MVIAGETRAATELREQGYTVLRGVLNPDEDIQPLIDEYGLVLDTLIKNLHTEGKIPHRFLGLSTLDRLTAFVAETGDEFFQHLSIHVGFDNEDANRPMYLHPEMFNLLRNPHLLDSLEQFIGSEISVNSLHITRIKPPEKSLAESVQGSPNGAISKTLWHQDLWAFQTEADNTKAITAWVPVVSADEENGCLLVVPYSHLPGELAIHCKPSERRPSFKGIPDEIVSKRRVAVPCEVGDVLILDKLMQHSSLENTSNRLRWSFDLRYQPIGQPPGQGGRPAWVARSRSNPDSEMRIFEEWEAMWRGVLIRESEVGVKDHTRFSLNNPLCI